VGTTTNVQTELAYDDTGAGTPVVLIHGLTFDRSSWRPIVEELHGSVRTVAVDMPAHGGSPGPPLAAEQVAGRVHDLILSLGVGRPVVVGHSYGAAVASLYVANYPSSGVVMVDSGPEIQPLAELVHQAAPMLRGDGFADAWSMIENSLGLDLIPEPVQTLVRDGHKVDQRVVLGYWEQMLSSPPAEFQAWIDSVMARIDVPLLAVYGHQASRGDRQRLDLLPDVRIEEHPGKGHLVHLVDPAEFARSLRRFADHCAAA
jgi:pimeloyl-ACP methyl ester carboxylesterase